MAVILEWLPGTLVGSPLAARHELVFLPRASSDSNAGVTTLGSSLSAIRQRVIAVVTPATLPVSVVPDVGVIPNASQIPLDLTIALPDVEALGVNKGEGVVIHICVGVDPTPHSNRIALNIPPDRRVVIAEVVVVQRPTARRLAVRNRI